MQKWFTIALIIHIFIRVFSLQCSLRTFALRTRLIRKIKCETLHKENASGAERGLVWRERPCNTSRIELDAWLVYKFLLQLSRFSTLLLNLFKNMNLCISCVKQIMNVFQLCNVQWNKNFSYFPSNFAYFLPHFGPPGRQVAHPGRPWLYVGPIFIAQIDIILLLETVKWDKIHYLQGSPTEIRCLTLLCGHLRQKRIHQIVQIDFENSKFFPTSPQTPTVPTDAKVLLVLKVGPLPLFSNSWTRPAPAMQA